MPAIARLRQFITFPRWHWALKSALLIVEGAGVPSVTLQT